MQHNPRDGSGRHWRTASSSRQRFRPPKRWSIPKGRSRTGAEMSVSRSVAEVLADHVTLEVEGIDRMYLNVYVPGLQREQGVACFFRFHRGNQFVSSALMDPISKTFIAALEAFARQEKVPVYVPQG